MSPQAFICGLETQTPDEQLPKLLRLAWTLRRVVGIHAKTSTLRYILLVDAAPRNQKPGCGTADPWPPCLKRRSSDFNGFKQTRRGGAKRTQLNPAYNHFAYFLLTMHTWVL